LVQTPGKDFHRKLEHKLLYGNPLNKQEQRLITQRIVFYKPTGIGVKQTPTVARPVRMRHHLGIVTKRSRFAIVARHPEELIMSGSACTRAEKRKTKALSLARELERLLALKQVYTLKEQVEVGQERVRIRLLGIGHSRRRPWDAHQENRPATTLIGVAPTTLIGSESHIMRAGELQDTIYEKSCCWVMIWKGCELATSEYEEYGLGI
jgi:hypothetical protein